MLNILLAWWLSWNVAQEAWRGDTLRFSGWNASYPGHYFRASSPVDGGYCRGIWLDPSIDNWSLYQDYHGVVPSASDGYDSLIFYAWIPSGQTHNKIYVQVRNDDLGGWSFTDRVWRSSSYSMAVTLTSTPQRFSYPIWFPSFGHFRIRIVPFYDLSAGADTFYLDSVGIKRPGPYKKRLGAKERSGYVLFGFDVNDYYQQYMLDFKDELRDCGFRFARLLTFNPHYDVIKYIDAENDTIDTFWARSDSVITQVIDSLGMQVIPLFIFSTSSWNLSGVGMRYYTSGGSRIPYQKDAALAVTAWLKHYSNRYFPLFLVLNEQQGGMVGNKAYADSFVNVFYTIRDSIWSYRGEVPCLVAGDWYYEEYPWLDSIGCNIDCLNRGWVSNHLYGHPVGANRAHWTPRDWMSYTYGMLWNTNGNIMSWQTPRWHIVDEFHTSIDTRYDCSSTEFWQWLGLPMIFAFHRPVIIMDHLLMNNWAGTSCNATFDWATHDTGSLYWGFRFLAKYAGQPVYTEDINSPFVYFRIGPNVWVVANPSQVDTFVCELPRGFALVRHLDRDLYDAGQNPIVEERRALGGKFLLPPGSFYAIEYKTVTRR